MSRGTVYTFQGLEAFAAQFPAMVRAELGALTAAVHEGLHARALELAREVSPVGGLRPDGRPSLRASWRSEPADVAAAIAAGKRTRVFTDAPHARVVEQGRKVAATYTRRYKSGRTGKVQGRRIGSTQAPVGMTTPVLTRLAAEEAGIVEAAIARTLGGGA